MGCDDDNALERLFKKAAEDEKGKGREIPPLRKVLQSLFSIKQSFPHLVLEGSSTLYPINWVMAHKTLHCPAQQTERESETKAQVLQHSASL